MTKFNRIIAFALAGAIAAGAVSCKKDQPVIDNPTDGDGQITLSTHTLAFPVEGDTKTVEVTGKNWTATSEDEWIDIETSEGLITVTVGENEAADVRNGSITVKNGEDTETVAVSQEGTDGPEPTTTYRIDDLWPDAENPEGIVFWIDPKSSTDGGQTGTSGWVMSLKQAPELAWCSNRQEVDFGTNSDIDGRLNRDAIWAYDAANSEFTGKFEIFNWCREEFGDPWYIPSLQEMRRFMAAYTGLTPEQTITYINGRRLFSFDQIFGAGTWEGTTAHRQAYDSALIAAGGDALGGGQLWTSTKYDVDHTAIEVKPWYVDFLGGWGSSGTQGQHDGHFTRAMRRFGAELAPDELSVNPTSLTFDAVDSSVKTVTVTMSAAEYDATTAAAHGTSEWIQIEKSANSFTVSVREYTAAEADEKGYLDRTGWITVAAGFAPAVTVTVTQTAPVPAEPLDLTGTWNWTGEIWQSGAPFWVPMTGTVTAEYNDAGYYIFKTMLENQGMTDIMDPSHRVDGGVALYVADNNTVQFKMLTPLEIYFDLWRMGSMFRGYWNYVSFFNTTTNGNLALNGLPAETAIGIGVSPDGNTLTFPQTGMFNDNGVESESIYGFGFGYMDIVSMEDHTISPTASPIQPGGVYRNLVFTRAN
jgi:hypothetical protein